MKVLFLEDRSRSQVAERGAAALAANKVAVLTLAGGVGSRLGFNGPKGLFKITSSGQARTLFERQREKIDPSTPWVIMVSPKTKSETLRYLQTTLCQDRPIYVIEQEEVPALDQNEQPLHNSEGELILMPNGNGAVFRALQQSPAVQVDRHGETPLPRSILAELQAQGIECLNIVSVDNVLVKIADPCAIGYLYEQQLAVVSAAVKIQPGEQMGLFIKDEAQNTFKICEYIDTPKGEVLTSHDAPLGNIANHLVKLDFLSQLDPAQLPYHQAIKKIPHASDPYPEFPNAIKRELFIFDGFNLSDRHGVVEYPANAYEGLKNKEGDKDSIASCTRALNKEGK